MKLFRKAKQRIIKQEAESSEEQSFSRRNGPAGDREESTSGYFHRHVRKKPLQYHTTR